MNQEMTQTRQDQIFKLIEARLNNPVTQIGDWVLSPLITARLGLTEMSMREYRRTATWAEGIHWQKNPKGRIVYNVKAIDKWMATSGE